MSQFCERKSTWVYESNARAQVLCSGVWTWAIPGSLRKPHLPLEKVTVDALPMSVSASVPSRVPGWMSALPACLSQTATGGSGTTSEVSVWAIGHVHMKTLLLVLESLRGPGLFSSVGYFLTSRRFLTLTLGREQEDLVGVKIFLKSIVRLIIPPFNLNGQRDFWRASPLGRGSPLRAPSHVSHERSDVRKVSPHLGPLPLSSAAPPEVDWRGPLRLRRQPPGEMSSPAGRWQM